MRSDPSTPSTPNPNTHAGLLTSTINGGAVAGLKPGSFPHVTHTIIATWTTKNRGHTYLIEDDRRFALNTLDNWNPTGGFKQFDVGLGSRLPTIRFFYDPEKVLRCLAKIAINLLYAYCPNTPVNRETFLDVIRVVRGETPVQPRFFQANGFVYALDISPISNTDSGHSFRLLHMDGQWRIYSSFFGGRIGSIIQFPGPNKEEWFQADIYAPLRSKDWTKTTGRIIQPLTVRVEWKDMAKIFPTFEMLNVGSEIHLKQIQKKNI